MKFKYIELANWIQENIENGTFPAGHKIPTEDILSEQFSISRYTVRQAILSLEKMGYLYRIQGSGTYVSENIETILREKRPAVSASNMIGMVLSNDKNHIFPDIIRGVSEHLASQGYLLNFRVPDNDFLKQRQAIEELLSFQPAGMIIEPAYSDLLPYNDDIYRELAKQIPTIMIHTECTDSYPALSLHDREGARMVVNYLIEKGHTKIGTIFCYNEPTAQTRYMGVLDALYSHDITPSEDLDLWVKRKRVNDLFHPTGGIALDRMLKEATAVFCHDDRIAYALICYLRSRNIRVPEDISVIGYDDSFFATIDVNITSVTHPKVQYGINAAKAILDMIQTPEEFDITKYESQPELIVRDTVASIKDEGKDGTET